MFNLVIDRRIEKFIVTGDRSVKETLERIGENKSRIIFVVSEDNILEGICTDGDVRRWLLTQEEVDLKDPVHTLCNLDFVTARIDDDTEKINALFSDKIEYVPLLDERGHLIAVARRHRHSEELSIGDYKIDADSPTFLIAEIGINHNGDLALGKELIDLAADAGANCVKFQMRDLSELYRNAGDASDIKEDLGSQYTMDIIGKSQLSTAEMFTLFDYTYQKGIIPLCTAWDLNSVQQLENYGMEAFKVASADLTNHDLLVALAQTGKPLICSTGMSSENEIIESVAVLTGEGCLFALLHCNSTYPAPFRDININYIERLREIGSCPVGYSGHERGTNIAVAAVAKGAKIIEKHITVDKSMEGNDHKVSLLPDEFASMVQAIREVEEGLGTAGVRRITQGEMINRENLAKSLVSIAALEPGDVVTAAAIGVKSPGRGLQPNRKKELIGMRVRRKIVPGDFFYQSDMAEKSVEPRDYRFNRPWGVPVRYHDFEQILERSNPDFLEFHFSYKDLEEDISNHFSEEYDMGLVVHSPDLFAGDHLLNLCAEDAEYRVRSIQELQRVVDVTRELKNYFKRAERPIVIASVGGFTKDGFVSDDERTEMYGRVAESLARVDAEGVEILPQTVPAFPWYFGGQMYLNIFVEPDGIVSFCERYGYRVCLDISHSKLACNHLEVSFKQFIQKVGRFAAHLHVVDAAGLDGEGLQVGEGEIDFAALGQDLYEVAPQASFIPEIWQGHKNGGEGFWVALDRLEKDI